MATALLAVFILVVSVSLAVAGLVLAQRRIPLELRQSHNVAIGVVYGALQITFGVIVGFSAFLVLDKYTTAQNTVTSEAADVVEIHRLAEQLPETHRYYIQELAESYTRVVVQEEWPMMGAVRRAHVRMSSSTSSEGASKASSPLRTLSG